MTVTLNYHALQAMLAESRFVRYIEREAEVAEATDGGETHEIVIQGIGKATEAEASLVAMTRRIFFETVEQIRSSKTVPDAGR